MLNDELIIKDLYEAMYRAMVDKDMIVLNNMLDEDFQIIHKNGMIQSKEDYLKAIKDSVMNFYSYQHHQMIVNINKKKAILIGQTTFQYGHQNNPSTSRLQLCIQLQKKKDNWIMNIAVGSEY